MKLNKMIQDKIINILESVEYGRVTFFLNPEKKSIDYTKEESKKIPIEEPKTAEPRSKGSSSERHYKV